MKNFFSLLLIAISCFYLIEAKRPSTKGAELTRQSQQMISKFWDLVSRADLRREGRAISKRKLAWMKPEELMNMPIMKLHSIPDKSWSGLTSYQASKLTASFVSRLSQEQARKISPKAVKSMSQGAKRAHARLTNRPSAIFRLTTMAIAGSVAFILYRYTSTPIKIKN